jgi:hypothetical protein
MKALCAAICYKTSKLVIVEALCAAICYKTSKLVIVEALCAAICYKTSKLVIVEALCAIAYSKTLGFVCCNLQKVLILDIAKVCVLQLVAKHQNSSLWRSYVLQVVAKQ